MCHKYSGTPSPPFGDLNCLNSGLTRPGQRGYGAPPHTPRFRLVKCPHPPSFPPIPNPPCEPREGAPPTRVPSFCTGAAISLKSTLLQVREGGSPSVQAGSPSPAVLHQLGQLSPPRRSPPPTAAWAPELVPAPAPGSLVWVGTPHPGPSIPPLVPDSRAAPEGRAFVPSSRSLWGLTLAAHSPAHLHVVH